MFGLGLGGLTYLLLAAAIALIPDAGSKAFDSVAFHVPAIRQFLGQWPAPDLSDYPVASAPGLHLALAGLARALGYTAADLPTAPLQLVNALFVAALIGVVGARAARRFGTGAGAALVLPLLTSWYVVKSGVWVTSEGAAWLLVALTLVLALRGRPRRSTLAAMGLAVLAAVAVRHVTLWLAAVVWLAAWLGTTTDRTPDADGPWSPLVPPPARWDLAARARRVLPSFAVTVPAFALAAWLVVLWGGLTPPMFQAGAEGVPANTIEHTGGSPWTGAMVFTIFCLYGWAFVGFWLPDAGAVLRGRRPGRALVVLGVAVGLAFGVLGETTFGKAGGRDNAYWSLARLGPVVADRSVLLAATSALGAGLVGLGAAVLPARPRWILLGALAAFVAANSANAMAYVRYLEPFVLLWLILATCEAPGSAGPRRVALLGPLALGTALAGLTLSMLTR